MTFTLHGVALLPLTQFFRTDVYMDIWRVWILSYTLCVAKLVTYSDWASLVAATDGSLMGLGVSRSVPSSPGERSPSDQFPEDPAATPPAPPTATPPRPAPDNNNKVSSCVEYRLELQTKVREDFKITRASSWLKMPTSACVGAFFTLVKFSWTQVWSSNRLATWFHSSWPLVALNTNN